MLSIQQVTKRFNTTLANDCVSLELLDKQITILLGANGAGKSTLLKCIVGFLQYEGSITLDGKKISEQSVKKQIAYVPEIPELYDSLTVRQHFDFVAHLYSIVDSQEAMKRYMKLFQLEEKEHELCGTLSKGMKQKVSIICALLIKPRVLILDEPLVGLDPSAIRQLKLLLSELKSSCSILICTHLIDSITSLWDQVVIMKKGHIVFQTTRDNMPNNQSLEQLYFEHVDPDFIIHQPASEEEQHETVS